METVTLRELRHNFPAVEKAAKKGPVTITRRGRVIGTYKASKTPGKWTPPDYSRRGLRTEKPVDVLDFL
jgi:antitoxin (DNA-binding transcriptional repressor) of toxin-antitoxin stability system